MTIQLETGERRTERLCFTMSLSLLMKIRENTKPHDVAAFIRRAMAHEARSVQCSDFAHLRTGNSCSLVVRATRDIVDTVAERSAEQLATVSFFIECCCWSFITKHQ